MMSSTTLPIKTPKKRVTMIKHVVGKVRTQPDPIPNVTFGIPNKIDEEGAGDVIQSWGNSSSSSSSSTSPSPPSSEPTYSSTAMFRSFVATNRKAIQKGCLDAKSQRDFALKNPVFVPVTKTSSVSSLLRHRMKKKNESYASIMKSTPDLTISSSIQSQNQNQHVFGIKSLRNDVPIQELLQSVHHGGSNFEELDYPDLSHVLKKGRLPPAKSTIASRLLEESISSTSYNVEEEKGFVKDSFKMKRFLKVESTVKAMLQQ